MTSLSGGKAVEICCATKSLRKAKAVHRLVSGANIDIDGAGSFLHTKFWSGRGHLAAKCEESKQGDHFFCDDKSERVGGVGTDSPSTYEEIACFMSL